MDHHCFFTDTCVGLHNHKDFILFLFYSTVVLLFVNVSMGFEILYNGKRFEDDVSGVENTLIIFCSATCFAISLFTGFLFGFNIYLMKVNLTTIEFNVKEIDMLKPYKDENALNEIFEGNNFITKYLI